MYWEEMRRTATLALPMMLGQLAAHGLQVIDLRMIGQLGVVPLAGAVFSVNFWSIFLLFCVGLVSALSILVGEVVGADRPEEAKPLLRNGLWLCTMLGTGITAILLAVIYGTDWWHLGQPVEVLAQARNYLIYLSLTIVPLLLFWCFKAYCEARHEPWLPLWFLLLSIVLNLFLNWLLIFGNLGFPRMEIEGAGLATLLSRILCLAIFWIYLARSPRHQLRWSLPELLRFDWLPKRAFMLLGIPIGLQICFEVSAFNVSSFMLGWLPKGAVAIAAHGIALNYAALAFMVPLGLSFAIAIRTGQARGAGNQAQARTIGWSGMTAAVLFMGLVAIVFSLGRDVLPWFFLEAGTVDADAVVALAGQLLLLAAAFALFDGTQITIMGALRGFRDVRFPTVVIFVVYWAGCQPAAFFLGFSPDMEHAVPAPISHIFEWWPSFPGLGLGAVGVWLGLTLGLATAATLLTLRFHVISRRPLVG